MSEKFLKARIPAELYEALQARASIEGKRPCTHIRELLERDVQSITTAEALTRIEASVAAAVTAAPAQSTGLDHGRRRGPWRVSGSTSPPKGAVNILRKWDVISPIWGMLGTDK